MEKVEKERVRESERAKEKQKMERVKKGEWKCEREKIIYQIKQ